MMLMRMVVHNRLPATNLYSMQAPELHHRLSCIAIMDFSGVSWGEEIRQYRFSGNKQKRGVKDQKGK
jgi:hypothetical protein